MPATVVLLLTSEAVLLVGMIVTFAGAVQVVRARRREAIVRAPLIATGIGFVIALVSALVLGADAAVHLTRMTFH